MKKLCLVIVVVLVSISVLWFPGEQPGNHRFISCAVMDLLQQDIMLPYYEEAKCGIEVSRNELYRHTYLSLINFGVKNRNRTNDPNITLPDKPVFSLVNNEGVPNQAELPKEKWLVCCDQIGGFYAKRTKKLMSREGYFSADGGDTWLNQNSCVIDHSGPDLKPDIMSCLLALDMTGKNFRGKESMYK